MIASGNDAIAIVGIGCRFPGGADTPERFWRLVADGIDAIGEIPADRYSLEHLFDADPTRAGKLYARWGGFLDRIDTFDAGFFGISPREAARIDPQHRLLLELAWEALEDACLPADRLAGQPVGVFVGISTHDYGDVQMYPAHRLVLDAHSNTGTATSIAANRISYLYDLRGPSLTVDTACSSSLTAIHLAVQSLQAGECTLALVGGVQVLLVPELTIGFCKATMLSPDGRCKAFDAAANGYVRSEGAGLVVLKPLSAALADGDPMYAVIRGSAVNQDGHTTGLTVPSAVAQEGMVRAALKRAGLAARDVHYVEAHGTGTPVGDPIEAAAIGAALSDGRLKSDPACAIGSVKTNIGHLEAAAGMAGLIKTALALKHRQIPASLHFLKPNPSIDFESLRLRVVTALEPWPNSPDGLPAAGVSSFGFGGSNAHVILQAAPPAPAAEPVDRETDLCSHVLTLSARSPEALRALAADYRTLLGGESAVYDVCAAAALARAHLEHRVGVVGASTAEMIDGLDAFLSGDTRANVISGRAPQSRLPKLAFVFSGMGPQWWAMGRQLLGSEPVFRDVIERCDAALRPYAGFSLMEELTRDENTSRVGEADLAQMTNFAIQVGLVALWESWGIRPDAVIGHSAGEMAAAYAAGGLDLESSLWLAYHRSRLQSRAVGRGRMMAVGLPPSEVVELLPSFGGGVALAAVNSPSSVTLSGDSDALEALMQSLQDRQVFARLLPVEVPYHSHHMDAIRDELLDSLSNLEPRSGSVPMVSVVTGDWIDASELGAEYWWRNVRQPVQFADGVERLADDEFTAFLEVGPHPVLGMSVSECLTRRGVRPTVLASLRRLEDERGNMLRSLSTLHAQGHAVDWRILFARKHELQTKLPTYPWQRERHWLELTSSVPDDDAAGVRAGEHPLLGGRVRTARPLWEAGLGDGRLAYLDDHLVQGALVFPGAAYLEMALSAGRTTTANQGGSIVLRDVKFERALFIADRSDTLVQLGLDPDRGRWEIHSRTRARDAEAWTRHASGLVEATDGPSANVVDLSAVLAACTTEVDSDDFYAALRRRGLDLGGAFHAIRQLWVGTGQALGAIHLVETVDPTPYAVHPALLDAALQCMVGAAFGADVQRDRGGVFLPVHVDRLTLHSDPPRGACFGFARLRSAPGDPPMGDVALVGETGAVCLTVQGLRCQVLGAGRSTGAADDIDDWLYEYRWEPRPLTSADTPPGGPDLSRMVAQLQAAANERSAAWDWHTYYATVEERLNSLALAHITRCMADLGWMMTPGEFVTTDGLAVRLGVTSARRMLFERLVAVLADRGLLRADGAGWRVERTAATVSENLEDLLRAAPAYEAEIRLLDRCGGQLAGVLRGTIDAREVLFTEPALGLAARMYRDSPPSRVYNTLTAETVGALLAGADSTRQKRVLEIGGGTGGTTAYVMPRVAAGGAEYTFTDISPLFAERAKLEFEGQGPFIARALDIEIDPVAQGLAPHRYDVVVASNVLHATADLATTLGHVKRLLAPGGALVLQEITRHPFWLDIIFGLTDGWWRFTDRELRPAHALLEGQQWRAVLERSGFEDVGVMGDVLPTGTSAQAVIVGRSATSLESAADTAEWLIVSPPGNLAEQLVERFASRGQQCVIVSDIAMQTEVLDRPLRGIVYLGGLDLPGPLEDLSAPTLLDASVDACAGALSLMQAVARHDRQSAGLTIVTAGAQPFEPGDADLALDQAPLWGFARVAMREQARLRCRLIDLDRAAPTDASADDLVCELLADRDEREEEVAFRAGNRHIRRLRRASLAGLDARRARRPRVGDEPFQVQIATPGALETLELRGTARRTPGPGEVEIEVQAASLNFRDVMLAMGLLSPLATDGTFGRGELGIDCSGIVRTVGPGVVGFEPGDAVLAIAAGALASHVTTSATLVARRPDGLDPDQASTLLCAFVTAEYALLHLARLVPNERVLIHAATGGVGLAAVQVAQAVGAEVYATAGSPEKRAYLAALEVPEHHIMDSRSLQFADDILEQTHGQGIDVVLNSLAGAAIEKGLSVLRPYGRFVEIGKRDIYANSEIGLLAFRKNQSFFALDLDRLCAERTALVGSLIQDVAGKVASGVYRPTLHTTFGISKIEDAMRFMAHARHMGKVVLSLADPDARLTRPASDAPLFRADGTYLISGGLGGFGLATAEWMAGEGAGTLVLVGRGGVPVSADDTLARVRGAGARVEVRRADISDPHTTRDLLQDVRQALPPLRGVVHAAMVLDDGPLDQLDRERLARVMAPKLAGAWNLHQQTLDDPLECFVLFSSIASLLGNPLQANYAAANAFFGPLAHQRQAAGRPALCVDWGVLTGVGYLASRPEVADHLARQGYLGFDADQALAVLGQLLRRDVAHIMAARMDWRTWARSSPTAATAPNLLDFAVADETGPGSDSGERTSLRTGLLAATTLERQERLAAFLRERVARILGTAASRLDLQAPLVDLGFDSLMAVELTTVLAVELGVEMAVVKLLQGVSLNSLAVQLLEELNLPQAASAADPPPAAPAAPAADPPPALDAPLRIDTPSALPLPTPVAADPSRPATDYARLDYTRWSLGQRLVRLSFGAALRLLTDLHVEGLENLPAQGAYVLAANHISLVDAPLIMTVLPRRTIVFAGERLRESRVFNWFLSDLANAIYIKRGAGDIEAVERGLAVLKAGGVLGVGPEGGISQTGMLSVGHSGVAYLAIQADVPVVPVAAWGQEQLAQQWRRLRRPRVHVRIGAPVRFPPGDADGLTLRAYTDQVMHALADLLPPEYRGAYAAPAEMT